MSMTDANMSGDQLVQLRELARIIASEIDMCDDAKLLPQLARQYRETVARINEIDLPTDDGVEEILEGCDHVR